MSETWFKTGGWKEKIQPVEVVKTTEKFVTIREERFSFGPKKFDERRCAKEGSYDRYFPTWEEAHAYLLNKAEAKLVSARRSLELAQGELGNVKGMKKPEA